MRLRNGGGIPAPFYAIADAGVLAGLDLSLAQGAIRMLRAGARWVQLRGKGLTSRELYDETVAVMEEASRHSGAVVIVNDRVDIAMAARADGVHLGQDDMSPADARRLLEVEALIGWSTHSQSQGLRARRLPVDYVAVGPVSGTQSKESPDPVVPLDLLPCLRGAVRKPLVAIGGVTPASARRYLARGADSVAVISAIVRAGALEAGVAQFLEATR